MGHFLKNKTALHRFQTHLSRTALTFAVLGTVLWTLISGAAHLTPEEQHNIHVYESASPAVVHIAIEGKSRDYFFGLIPFQATGSGVIISKDGYILTNNHVVEDAETIEVTMMDGNVYEAELIGTGDEHDIALIKIKLDEEEDDEESKDKGEDKDEDKDADEETSDVPTFPIIEMADSEKLIVGQKVFALGGPFGLKNSFSSGVISSLHRRIGVGTESVIENVIQTDAAINPGNSGGALLDTEGKLVGINTAMYSPSGGSAGIGFAIPVNTAKRIISDLKQYGHVIRPWLGVQIETEVKPQMAKELKLGSSKGLLIKQVKAESPADKAGLRGGTHQEKSGHRRIMVGGDIIVAVDDQPAENAVKFIDYIESKRVGDTVKLEFIRNGKPRTVEIKLTEKERKNKDNKKPDKKPSNKSGFRVK